MVFECELQDIFPEILCNIMIGYAHPMGVATYRKFIIRLDFFKRIKVSSQKVRVEFIRKDFIKGLRLNSQRL